jgi:hypothetical protein
MFDSQGGTSKKYIADLREMEKELVIAYYQHLIPSYLDLGTSRKSIGNRGDVSLLSFMDDRGVRIEDILFDTRASSTLFWLIWSTVFGTLGSITCIVFWLRGRRV